MTTSTDLSKVCAVIVTYQPGEVVRDCIKSVADQAGCVIVVDNGSCSEAIQQFAELEVQGQISVIYNPTNLGIAGALNQGVRRAMERGFRWVLTLDHDSVATPGMVGKLVRVFEILGDNVGIVSANAFDRNAQVFLGEPSPAPDSDNIIEARFSISSGCLIDARVFDKIGFFNEPLFMYYVDTDFFVRVRRSGLKTYICPSAVLLHSEGSKEVRRFLRRRTLHNSYGKEARYYIARNAIYMLSSYYDDLGLCWDVARRLLKDSAKVLLFDRERAVTMRFIMKGLWDGLRGRYGVLNFTRSGRQL